jgi:hypothetical protein
MMKKCVCAAVVVVLAVCFAGSAHTGEKFYVELEDSVETFMNSLGNAGEHSAFETVVCSLKGETLSDSDADPWDEWDEWIRYYQGKNGVALTVEYTIGMHAESYYISFESKDPKMKFPRGLKIGAPIKTALNAKIEGKYSKENRDGGVFHKWKDGVRVVGIFEKGGKIATIGIADTGAFKGFTVNPKYAGYIP